MSNFDIFEFYFPAIGDIDEAEALDVRSRIEKYAQAGWPDLDMRPGSVFGDFILTPLAYMVAGAEVAMDRFRSDLTPENVANGIIYDCDFVAKFLENFAVTARDNVESTGIVRLVFNTDQDYFIDRSVLFSLNNYVFRVYAANAGGVTIKRVGYDPQPGSNDVKLIDRGDGTFSADIPVKGNMAGGVVDAGDTALVSKDIPELMSAKALINFLEGTPPTSIPLLAARSRSTIHASGNSTAGGILRYIDQEFPGMLCSSVVVSGDAEMLRDSNNPFGISDGRVDILIKSPGYAFEETQFIRLPYDANADRYIAKMILAGQPYKIVSLKDTNGTVVASSMYDIYSRSTDGLKADMAAAAYSDLEELFIVLNVPLDSNGAPVLAVQYDVNGDAYVDLEVVYKSDPMVSVVRTAMYGRDNRPLGADVLVKGFVPIIFNRFLIKYSRTPGTSVKLETAKSEILSYIQSTGYPDIVSEAKVNDGVFLAGAHDVTELDVVGEVQWSIADYFIPYSAPSPIDDYTAAIAARRKPPRVTMPSVRALRNTYRDANIGTASQTNVVVGVRNATYMIEDADIEFSEQQ